MVLLCIRVSIRNKNFTRPTNGPSQHQSQCTWEDSCYQQGWQKQNDCQKKIEVQRVCSIEVRRVPAASPLMDGIAQT